MLQDEPILDQLFPVLGDAELMFHSGQIDSADAQHIARAQRDQTIQSLIEFLEAIVVDTANGYKLRYSSSSMEAWMICSWLCDRLQEWREFDLQHFGDRNQSRAIAPAT